MKAGILTFYCSDNYGAMLQACGLKCCVEELCPETEIIPYAPPFLTGRHWFIPYYPFRSPKTMMRWTRAGFRRNLQKGWDFFRQKRNMNKFRKQYLVRGQRRIRTVRGLSKTFYDIYIAGSDQIWNPDITFGLRRAYFGAFTRPAGSRVIAYAASLGGKDLPGQYEEKMRTLLLSIDDISLREEAAVPYIKKLTDKDVTAVSDPVFFLDQRQWREMEILPREENYILVYDTEQNPLLRQYAKELASEKGMAVIELKPDRAHADPTFKTDICAGPSEFLGYIHKAGYVVTNSFHGMAFSIIFHKQFVAFSHSSRNARLENILMKCGLRERMVFDNNCGMKIDDPVCWPEVDGKVERMAEESRDFLRRCLKKVSAEPRRSRT